MQDDARIGCTGSGAHAQAIEGSKSERAINAFALAHRTYACAAAKMRDDDTTGGDLRRDLGKDTGDIFVREAVEAIALHTCLANLAWQCDELGYRWLSAMKARVEAGHLRHVRQSLEYG